MIAQNMIECIQFILKWGEDMKVTREDVENVTLLISS